MDEDNLNLILSLMKKRTPDEMEALALAQNKQHFPRKPQIHPSSLFFKLHQSNIWTDTFAPKIQSELCCSPQKFKQLQKSIDSS
ncbi:hypothetical protein GEMRC1_002940 [Eukaryota sp. GEM-RC1]